MSTIAQHSAPSVAAPSRPRTWLRRIIGGGQIIETCPTFRDGTTWCVKDHTADASGMLDDLTHASAYVGTEVTMHVAGTDRPESWPILAARIDVDPYSEDPARNLPHITFEPSVDDVAECLTPDALAAIVAQIRAHCDRLDDVVKLAAAARAEYGAH